MDKFDIEIVMPVSNKGKYGKRLEDFKKYGLVNFKDWKVRLVLLVGTEEIPDLLEGWHENTTPVEMIWTHDHCAAKVNAYYANMFPEDLNHTDWYMRLDDDSITNIDGLMNALKEFDPEEKQYLTADLFVGDTRVERHLLNTLGIYDSWLDRIIHEVECCVLSKPLLEKILNNETTKKLINLRSVVSEGYTDICIGACVKILKMHPTKVDFLTSEPRINDFIHKSKVHIHKLAHDVNANVYHIAKCFLQNNQTYSFVGKELILGVKDQATNATIALFPIVLKPNGLVVSPQIIKESYWSYDSKKICFYGRNVEFLYAMDLEDSQLIDASVGMIFLKSL